MVLWHCELDPYITIHPSTTASCSTIVLNKPGLTPSIHITIYLPTSGKETEFLTELSNLDCVLEEMKEKYPDCPVFLRGDGNVNKHPTKRVQLMDHIISKYSFVHIPSNFLCSRLYFACSSFSHI